MNRHVSWRSANFPKRFAVWRSRKRKEVIRDLNIAWASKSVEVDLATLSKDNLSTSLVPEDIYSQPQAGIPVAQWFSGQGL